MKTEMFRYVFIAVSIVKTISINYESGIGRLLTVQLRQRTPGRKHM